MQDTVIPDRPYQGAVRFFKDSCTVLYCIVLPGLHNMGAKHSLRQKPMDLDFDDESKDGNMCRAYTVHL